MKTYSEPRSPQAKAKDRKTVVARRNISDRYTLAHRVGRPPFWNRDVRRQSRSAEAPQVDLDDCMADDPESLDDAGGRRQLHIVVLPLRKRQGMDREPPRLGHGQSRHGIQTTTQKDECRFSWIESARN
jgi:hypothetical protein